MNADLGRYRVVSDRDPAFPWTKFERLLHVQEIFEPQWEDRVPTDPREAVSQPSFSPGQFVWLLMEDVRALGFVLNSVRGRFWVDAHMGFRPGVPGVAKKLMCVWVQRALFCELDIRKISAFVPEFNRPARVLARSLGFRQEGYIPANVWRNSRAFGTVVYGMTRDEFIVWLQFFSKERADIPAEQSERGANVGSGHPDERAVG